MPGAFTQAFSIAYDVDNDVGVEHFVLFLLRVDGPESEIGGWGIGDIVRAQAIDATHTLFANPRTAQPRKAVLVCRDANLTRARFEELQIRLTESDLDPPGPSPEPGPPLEDTIVSTRKYRLSFDPLEYADLPPPKRAFMDALVAELTVPPYGAIRDWRDVDQAALKGKRGAGRPNL